MPAPDGLLDPLFTTATLRDIFCDHGRLQGMLDFEAALARAEGRVGVIPAQAVGPIVQCCRAQAYDVDALAAAAAAAGNPAIPLVKALTHAVAMGDEEAARFVHWGATSQDMMDSGLVLQLRAALDVLGAELDRAIAASAVLARNHRGTVLAGRTWMQQALPVTFGLKAAGWLGALERQRDRLREARARALALQFGGAAGTLAALGDAGAAVSQALAAELALDLPPVPWHTMRDRVAEVATCLGLLTGTLGKIARDISLLGQAEVGEVAEPAAPGRGGSSTMPHKRNPVACAVVLSAAQRVPGLVAVMLGAMVQEHERGLGGWHAEWQTLPEICLLAGGALNQLNTVLEGLEVYPERMRRNLGLTRGLIMAEAVTMALGARLGRLEAHELVEEACRRAVANDRGLRDELSEDARVMAHLTPVALDALLDPATYTGSAGRMVDRALAARDGGGG